MHSNLGVCFCVWRAVPFKWNITVTRSNGDDFGTNDWLNSTYTQKTLTLFMHVVKNELTQFLVLPISHLNCLLFPAADNIQNAFVNPCGNV